MTLEEAIQTAIEYEQRVRDTYVNAGAKLSDPVGKRVFEVLAKEEEGHVKFLEASLKEWRETGRIVPQALPTAVPSPERIQEELSKLEKPLEATNRQSELELLKGALEAERTTSQFYQETVASLPKEQQALFEPFVAIEEGHKAIVQAEIDALVGHGFWFDFMEFDLEAG